MAGMMQTDFLKGCVLWPTRWYHRGWTIFILIRSGVLQHRWEYLCCMGKEFIFDSSSSQSRYTALENGRDAIDAMERIKRYNRIRRHIVRRSRPPRAWLAIGKRLTGYGELAGLIWPDRIRYVKTTWR